MNKPENISQLHVYLHGIGRYYCQYCGAQQNTHLSRARCKNCKQVLDESLETADRAYVKSLLTNVPIFLKGKRP